MDLTPNQLKGKPKKIGELDGKVVMQAETKGGFFIIMTKSGDSGTKVLGTGSHPAVARHIAERDFPGAKLTELSKSETLDADLLRAEAAKFLPLTRRIQKLEK